MPITKESRKKMPLRGQGKLNRTVKETVLAVFNEIQNDPKIELKAFAKKYPRDFYAIAAKLIPTEVNAKIGNRINLHIVRSNTGITPAPSGTDSGTEFIEEIQYPLLREALGEDDLG